MSIQDNLSFIPGIGDEVILGIVSTCFLVYILYKLVIWCLGAFGFSETEGLVGNEELNAGRIRSNNHDCAICLGEASYAIETNCGHIFCGQCIISYYNTIRTSSVTTVISPFDTPTCPMCRQRMTVLLLYFSEVERNTADLEEISARNLLIGSVRDYNRRYSGEARSLLEHLRDLPVLLRHLVSFIWSGEGITWLFRLRIFILGAMAGVYLLSPFDIVPEAVFGLIGILDDIIVLALFALYAGILYRNFVVDNGN